MVRLTTFWNQKNFQEHVIDPLLSSLWPLLTEKWEETSNHARGNHTQHYGAWGQPHTHGLYGGAHIHKNTHRCNFLHQVRFLQVFFLWHCPAWFCTRFKLSKWNCSAIWNNLSSFHSNLRKIVVQSYCSISRTLCFPHQFRFLHQVFFLWHSLAWFCSRFKLWKWNCSAIWNYLHHFIKICAKLWCRPIAQHKVMSRTSVLFTSSQILTSSLLSLVQSGMVLHQIQAVEVKL